MPKRVIDGEALWLSTKLKKVQPEEFRAELANLIPLALADGSFEADADLIQSRVYSFLRPSVTIQRVAAILDEFERVGILGRWEVNGKTWGYWIGINKPGRLPPPSRLDKNHEKLGETPPDYILSGQSMASQRSADGCVGFGFGSGSGFGFGGGFGSGSGSSEKPLDEVTPSPETIPQEKNTSASKRLFRSLADQHNRSIEDAEVYARTGRWPEDAKQ